MKTASGVGTITRGRSVTKRVASNFGWSMISEVVGKGVFFFTNIYLARTLGVESFGLFILAQTITFYFWLAVDLGTNMYGIREIAKDKANAGGVINQLLTMRITAGFLVFIVYMLSLFLIDMPFSKKLPFIGCGFYLLTYAFYSDWIFKGLEKFNYIAFGSVVSSVAFLIGTIYLVKDNEGVVAASFVWALSYLLGSLSLLYFLYRKLGIKYRPSFELKEWLSHLKESIYFTISGSLMVFFQSLPILLLSIFFTSYEVGLFSAPYRIIITLCGAGFLLPMAIYPLFSELYQRDKSEFNTTHRKFRRIMLATGVFGAIVGTLFSAQIIGILLGSQYSESIIVFRILVWLLPLYFLRFTYGSILGATGNQKFYTPVAIVAILFLSIGFFFTTRYGLVGLSFLILMANLLVVILLAKIAHKRILI